MIQGLRDARESRAASAASWRSRALLNLVPLVRTPRHALRTAATSIKIPRAARTVQTMALKSTPPASAEQAHG